MSESKLDWNVTVPAVGSVLGDEPTALLRWNGDVLEQSHRQIVIGSDGVRQQHFEWRPVPKVESDIAPKG